MFSPKQSADLNAELHGLVQRYFPESRPCYRSALLHFVASACMIFDRYQVLFCRPGQTCPEDPQRICVDPDDCNFQRHLAGLLDSPHLHHGPPVEPDPRPHLAKQTGRHREPPPPPMS